MIGMYCIDIYWDSSEYYDVPADYISRHVGKRGLATDTPREEEHYICII